MALPLIAAGIAARAVGKKLATRAAGGITGKGAKSVNPTYKNSNLKIPSNAHPELHSKVSSNVKLVPSDKMKKTAAPFGPTSGAKQAMKENAQSINTSKRGLKAANKPVSKNNRNRLGDGEMSAYLKSIKPARPNRTRGGNLRGE